VFEALQWLPRIAVCFLIEGLCKCPGIAVVSIPVWNYNLYLATHTGWAKLSDTTLHFCL